MSIYAPPLTIVPSRHRQPPAGYLLMNFDQYLVIAIDSAGQQVETIHLPYGDLICVEIGHLLLFSWIKLVFGSREAREIKIPFNTVRNDLFVASFDLMRSRVEPQPTKPPDLVTAEPILDFKFTNVLNHWLRPKEVLLGSAFQPEVRARRLLVLERQVVAPLLAALTDRQFLTITEEPPASREKTGKFTEIYTYCPHRTIVLLAVEANSQAEEFAQLCVTLANGQARFSTGLKLSASVAPPFEQLCRLANDFLASHRPVGSHIPANG
jgi:hypothetical protein